MPLPTDGDSWIAGSILLASLLWVIRPNDTRVGDALHRIADELAKIAKALDQKR